MTLSYEEFKQKCTKEPILPKFADITPRHFKEETLMEAYHIFNSTLNNSPHLDFVGAYMSRTEKTIEFDEEEKDAKYNGFKVHVDKDDEKIAYVEVRKIIAGPEVMKPEVFVVTQIYADDPSKIQVHDLTRYPNKAYTVNCQVEGMDPKKFFHAMCIKLGKMSPYEILTIAQNRESIALSEIEKNAYGAVEEPHPKEMAEVHETETSTAEPLDEFTEEEMKKFQAYKVMRGAGIKLSEEQIQELTALLTKGERLLKSGETRKIMTEGYEQQESNGRSR